MDKSAIQKTGVHVRTDQTGMHIKTSTGMNIMSNMTGGSDLYTKTNKTLRHMREIKNVTQVRTDERGIYIGTSKLVEIQCRRRGKLI
jgi:hypothetical protein